MLLFSSGSTFTLCGLMLWPVAWQCSKTAEISWDRCSLIWVLDKGKEPGGVATVIVRTTPSSAESRKPLPLNKGDPSWTDMRDWTYHQFCADLRAKRAKATFCLKFDLLLISSSFGILWPKELEGLDWLFKFVARVEVTVDLKNKYRTIVATSRCQSNMCSKEKT